MPDDPAGGSAEPSDPPVNADRAETLPGTVTRVSPLRRARGRFAVEIDGRSGLSLGEDVLARAGIEVGGELDAETIARLLAEDEAARATETALAFLAYRPRSEREVRDRLRRGGYGQDAVDYAIARLLDWRYLDDEEFARRWIENRATYRPRGHRLLQQELRRKGIAAETARDAIEEADLDEAEAAEALARQRLHHYSGEDPAVVRRRLSDYLVRRGYGYGEVRAAVDRVMGESAEGVDDSAD